MKELVNEAMAWWAQRGWRSINGANSSSIVLGFVVSAFAWVGLSGLASLCTYAWRFANLGWRS